ncbi:hypothetical protein [Pedobacter sp. KBS0701]|uniref:hypothetical protein n=1 Tax=unclassified Pedobacter TaxID=2628915 RepID=UPI00143D1075|nr:hypothetical protein [Pedobacter sp. KBS0701]
MVLQEASKNTPKFWTKEFPFGLINVMPVAGIGQTNPYCVKMIANFKLDTQKH